MNRRIFALSDLHLSMAYPKPMDVFGPLWHKHTERIAENWTTLVGEDDIVLVAGDVSWALKLPEAIVDLEWLAALPGEKVFVRGNHDYWWSGIGKVRKAAPARMHFIQNDCVVLGDIAIGGTRLWDFPGITWPPANEGSGGIDPDRAEDLHAQPGEKAREQDDETIRARELDRLRMSLSAMPQDARLRIAMLHYPPVAADAAETELTALLEAYNIDVCVYGHLHGLGTEHRPGADCVLGRTRYLLTSCDWLECRPLYLPVE